MHSLDVLRDLVILVAVAIPVVAVAQRFKIPTIVGFLLTGIGVGPNGLGLISTLDSVAGLAELGVGLLLFAIGLELSLARIIRIGALVLRAGGLQVLGTMALVASIAMWLGEPTNLAVLLGGMVALSSTAIVLKVYADRGELDSPHGRIAVAVVLFQDLAVVPLLVMIPILAGGADGVQIQDFLRIAMSIGVLVLLVGMGRFLVPWVLERIVGLKNRELFTLCIALFGLAAAYATASLGLSLAIGAFMAGLVISESEYGFQALSDVLPFRDTFSGVFFMSVGMLLDVGFVATHAPQVLAGAAGLFAVKALVTFVVVRSMRRSVEVSVLTALGLAQVGEFSFILAAAADRQGLLPDMTYQLFLGAAVLSMLAAPFVIAVAGPFAARCAALVGGAAHETLAHEKKGITELNDHAIIVGYGLGGRYLVRVLSAAGFPYVVLEQNGQVVRAARQAGVQIFFGDGTRRDVLERVGIVRARVLVFSISAPAEERRGVAIAHDANPDLQIIVRTRRVSAIDDLKALGATDVVVEEFEAALELFAKVLARYTIPAETIREEIDAVRGEHYGMLRGDDAPDIRLEPLRQLAIHDAIEVVEVEEGSEADGESPVSLKLRHRTGAVAVAVLRDGKPFYTPDPEFAFGPWDLVILVGDRESLDRATPLFVNADTDERPPPLRGLARGPPA